MNINLLEQSQKTIKENNQSINLLDYFKQFFYKRFPKQIKLTNLL